MGGCVLWVKRTEITEGASTYLFTWKYNKKTSFCLLMLVTRLLIRLLARQTVWEESFIFLLVALPTAQFGHLFPFLSAVFIPLSSSPLLFELLNLWTFCFVNLLLFEHFLSSFYRQFYSIYSPVSFLNHFSTYSSSPD